MGVVVWGYRGGVWTLRIPYKLSTYGGFRHTNHCYAGFTKALHARIEEIDQCVVEYCRVDIAQQREGVCSTSIA